jgi:UDP-N-acetylglucosamine--N-acetylmuramyl-(pentapeptide) pyrophosphoryl-undecaprenol N-acetylglucosamine transferase
MDNHQYYNANALEDAGGGWVMPQEGFTAAALSARIENFLTLPESLARAALIARKAGRINAARDLADLVLRISANGSHDGVGMHAAVMEHAA